MPYHQISVGFSKSKSSIGFCPAPATLFFSVQTLIEIAELVFIADFEVRVALLECNNSIAGKIRVEKKKQFLMRGQ